MFFQPCQSLSGSNGYKDLLFFQTISDLISYFFTELRFYSQKKIICLGGYSQVVYSTGNAVFTEAMISSLVTIPFFNAPLMTAEAIFPQPINPNFIYETSCCFFSIMKAGGEFCKTELRRCPL